MSARQPNKNPPPVQTGEKRYTGAEVSALEARLNLVWFRNDLRLFDNPALCEAASRGTVVGLYIVTPAQWRAHHLGGAKVDFLLRNVAELSRALEKRGIPLLVRQVERFSQVPGLVADLAAQHDIDSVYWNDEYPVDEAGRDDDTAQRLKRQGVAVHRLHDRVIAPPGAVVKDDGGAYQVFTPFKRRWLQLLELGVPDALPAPRRQRAPAIAADAVPDHLADFASPLSPSLWPAGEVEAENRLADFCERRLADYEDLRDSPAEPATSRLSPYLAAGVVSPQACLRACLQNGDSDGAKSWLNELIWRDFYQHIVWAFPHVCKDRPFRTETEAVAWRDSDEDFQAWAEGRTGVPLVDAGMRELAQTGWMHNRVRMVTAMFLSKNLLLDWRLGEQFFSRHLVDADFAANNGGWQWSASTGTDAAPYFRIFNPFTQGRRFDPDGRYIKRFVPEVSAVPPARLHNADKLAASRPANYPPVCVDLKASRQRAMEAFEKT